MILINLILLVTLIAFNVCGSPANEVPKIRRGSVMMMYPFPRVGRSQPERTWLTQDFTDHDDMKRSYLIPFPRVGRNSNDASPILSSDSATGMWFGPRLGKVAKRSFHPDNLIWSSLKDIYELQGDDAVDQAAQNINPQ